MVEDFNNKTSSRFVFVGIVCVMRVVFGDLLSFSISSFFPFFLKNISVLLRCNGSAYLLLFFLRSEFSSFFFYLPSSLLVSKMCFVSVISAIRTLSTTSVWLAWSEIKIRCKESCGAQFRYVFLFILRPGAQPKKMTETGRRIKSFEVV